MIYFFKKLYRAYSVNKGILDFSKKGDDYKINFNFKSVCNSPNFKPRIAVITMVKNESDIIEEFVRFNIRWASHIFVIDDGSSDGTPDIISSLIDEGMPITLLHNKTIDYQQNYIMTSAVNDVARNDSFDYVLPLDADEIILDGNLLFSELNSDMQSNVFVLSWTSIIPNFASKKSCAPILQDCNLVIKECNVCQKMLLKNSLAKTAFIHMGNHGVTSKDANILKSNLTVPIYHVPVRSAQQILSKILIGSYKFALKKNKTLGEGSHWTNMANSIRNAGFVVGDKELAEFAYNYAGKHKLDRIENTKEANFDCTDLTLKYTVQSRSELLRALDSFFCDLVHRN